jgi:hypothetical protein
MYVSKLPDVKHSIYTTKITYQVEVTARGTTHSEPKLILPEAQQVAETSAVAKSTQPWTLELAARHAAPVVAVVHAVWTLFAQ